MLKLSPINVLLKPFFRFIKHHHKNRVQMRFPQRIHQKRHTKWTELITQLNGAIKYGLRVNSIMARIKLPNTYYIINQSHTVNALSVAATQGVAPLCAFCVTASVFYGTIMEMILWFIHMNLLIDTPKTMTYLHSVVKKNINPCDQ